MTCRVLPEANHNTSQAEEKRPARLRPIHTLKPGELAGVKMHDTVWDTINAWVGVVEAVDGVANRIEASRRRFDLSRKRSSGIIVIPWAKIDTITVRNGE